MADIPEEEIEGQEEQQTEQDEQVELEQEQEMMQQQQSAQLSQKKKLEERKLKGELNNILGDVMTTKKTSLNFAQQNTLRKAKKFQNLQLQTNFINHLLNLNRGSRAMKVMSSSPALYYVFLGALIFFLIICVVAIVSAIFGMDNGDGSGGASSQFGVTGTDFYGVRMLYKDDELAKQNIIEDYAQIVIKGFEEAKNTNLTDVEMTINITLPDDEFTYSDFNENDFKTDYPALYDAILKIAQIVYKVDNSVETTPATLVEVVEGIKYFGLVKVDKDEDGVDDVTELVQETVLNVSNSTFESTKEFEDGEPDTSQTDIETAKNTIKDALSDLLIADKYSIRAEKLFVQDFILEGDDKVSGVKAKNYVAMIFMPNKNVTFSSFSFAVRGADFANFNIQLSNNGQPITITKDTANLGDDETPAYLFMSGDVNVSVSAFENIDTSKKEALKDGLSLGDLVLDEDLDYTKYLSLEDTQPEGENNGKVYTFAKSGVIAEMQSEKPYTFVEYETKWIA